MIAMKPKICDMIVCTRSSTIAESASVGVIPIVLNNDEIVWENIERLKNIFDQKLILVLLNMHLAL